MRSGLVWVIVTIAGLAIVGSLVDVVVYACPHPAKRLPDSRRVFPLLAGSICPLRAV